MQNYCHPEMHKTEGHILCVEIAKFYCWLGMQSVFVKKNWLHLLGIAQPVHVGLVVVQFPQKKVKILDQTRL